LADETAETDPATALTQYSEALSIVQRIMDDHPESAVAKKIENGEVAIRSSLLRSIKSTATAYQRTLGVPETESLPLQCVPTSLTVTFQGKIVEGAQVTFWSQSVGGRTCQGTTDSSGKAILGTFSMSDGALPGAYRVSIAIVGGRLPARYGNPETSGIWFSVVRSATPNDFRVDLRD
jgi:hypothetical protein